MSFSVVREHDKCDTFAVAAGSCSTALPIVFRHCCGWFPLSSTILSLSFSLSLFFLSHSLSPSFALSLSAETVSNAYACLSFDMLQLCSSIRATARVRENRGTKEAACGRVMRMRCREIEFKRVFTTLGVHYVVELMWRTGKGKDGDYKL